MRIIIIVNLLCCGIKVQEKMTVKQITAANADEKIKQLYETAFPEDEQIPWKDLMRLVEEMPLDFTAYYDGEEFIGFTIVYPRKSINWFWYFAVCEKLRGKGYGQKILTQMIEHYKGQSVPLIGQFFVPLFLFLQQLTTIGAIFYPI